MKLQAHSKRQNVNFPSIKCNKVSNAYDYEENSSHDGFVRAWEMQLRGKALQNLFPFNYNSALCIFANFLLNWTMINELRYFINDDPTQNRICSEKTCNFPQHASNNIVIKIYYFLYRPILCTTELECLLTRTSFSQNCMNKLISTLKPKHIHSLLWVNLLTL